MKEILGESKTEILDSIHTFARRIDQHTWPSAPPLADRGIGLRTFFALNRFSPTSGDHILRRGTTLRKCTFRNKSILCNARKDTPRYRSKRRKDIPSYDRTNPHTTPMLL